MSGKEFYNGREISRGEVGASRVSELHRALKSGVVFLLGDDKIDFYQYGPRFGDGDVSLSVNVYEKSYPTAIAESLIRKGYATDNPNRFMNPDSRVMDKLRVKDVVFRDGGKRVSLSALRGDFSEETPVLVVGSKFTEDFGKKKEGWIQFTDTVKNIEGEKLILFQDRDPGPVLSAVGDFLRQEALGRDRVAEKWLADTRSFVLGRN